MPCARAHDNQGVAIATGYEPYLKEAWVSIISCMSLWAFQMLTLLGRSPLQSPKEKKEMEDDVSVFFTK
jgi:hypothetical protein